MEETYNGWSNRATWQVVNWFQPQSLSDIKNAMYQIEEAVRNCPDFLRDFINTDINWDELEANFSNDDIEEEEEEEEEDLDHYDMRKDIK
jgi:hypothetical protein